MTAEEQRTGRDSRPQARTPAGAARSRFSAAGQGQDADDDPQPRGSGKRIPASDFRSPASNIDQGRIVDYRLDTRGAPHEVFFNRVPSGRFDGGGSLVKYTRALFVQDLGTGNKSHGYLAQRPGGTRNSWHYKQMGGGGRPTGIRRPGAGPRDGLWRRTVQGSNTTDYVLDGQGAVRTLLNGALDRTDLHGARGPEYERIGSNSPLWYLYDGLGSVVGTIDGNGVIQQTRKYDVYGAVRSSTGGSGTKHKFVGSLGHPSEDETGLIYMRARSMDPVTGRFVSQDAKRDGVNWFAYVGNAPTTGVDPDGHSVISEILGGLLFFFGLFCIAVGGGLNSGGLLLALVEIAATVSMAWVVAAAAVTIPGTWISVSRGLLRERGLALFSALRLVARLLGPAWVTAMAELEALTTLAPGGIRLALVWGGYAVACEGAVLWTT